MKKVLTILAASVLVSSADDWPRWMGEKADGFWREEGVRKDLPEGGAPVKWRVPVGWGYGGPAVVGDSVFLGDYQRSKGSLMNSPNKAVTWEGKERLLCLDAKTGKQKWAYEVDREYELSYPGGPRATPTVVDGLVYFLGAMGHLACVDAKSGKLIWEKDFQRDFGAPLPIWGFSAHPLVANGTVYCIAGGDGSVAVALNAKTGEVKWKALDAQSQGYCPPSLVEAGGVEQLIIWHAEALNGLNPATGELYWSLPLKPIYGMSVMTPRVLGNKMFASGIGRVGAMVKLDEKKPTASFLWKGKPKTAMYCCNSTPLIVDGVIYGSDIRTSSVIAASMEDGKRFWQSQEPSIAEDHRKGGGSHGTAFLTFHEENKQFWIFGEMGDLILAEMTKEGYKELGRQHLLKPTNEVFGRPVVWSGPAFAGKSVYVRNDEELVKVDLSK